MSKRKILGQASPSATTETELYICPSTSADTVISTITVCNRSASVATFRISNSVASGATATKDYIYYDTILAGNDTFASTIGITISPTDVVRVYASTANLSFSLFGQEN